MSVFQTGVFNAIQGNPSQLNADSFASLILRRFPNRFESVRTCAFRSSVLRCELSCT